MAATDFRLKYVTENIAALAAYHDVASLLSQCEGSRVLISFLDDLGSRSLKAVFFDSKVDFFDNLSETVRKEGAIEIIFSKRTSQQLTAENISSVLDICTIQDSPLSDLYNALRNVYCPIMLENRRPNESVPPDLLDQLSSFKNLLGNFIDSKKDGIDNIRGVHEAYDEIKFWSRQDRTPLGKFVNDNLKELNADFYDLDALSIPKVCTLIETTQDALDVIWIGEKGLNEYPQVRMRNFFSCIGNSLCRYLQKQLAQLDVWSIEIHGNVRLKLQTAVKICVDWSNTPTRLINSWTNKRPWSGDVFSDTFFLGFKKRLEEVLDIRTVVDELYLILPPDDRASFQIGTLFRNLKDTQPFHYNPYSESLWKEALSVFQRAVDPMEAAAAAQFRRNVERILNQPQLLLREFHKYASLLKRPKISRELISQRETLLSLLQDNVRKIEASLENIEQGREDDENKTIQKTRLLTPPVANIVYLRQLGSKLTSILAGGQMVLNDLEGSTAFFRKCEGLIGRVPSEESKQFRSWCKDMLGKFETDESLKLQGSLLKWKDGMLAVNFSEKLVQFLREVRQLDELGLDFPKSKGKKEQSITEKALEIERVYRYGVLLKKTTNFYNTLQDQMIDVQAELLLKSLDAFYLIVTKNAQGKSVDEISWSNPTDCENYARMVQEAAEKLSSENRWLRKCHESLITSTVQLMNIELQRDPESWKAKWRAIKDKVTSVKSKYNEKDSATWIKHWDHQIYKAFEASYQMGLESLSENNRGYEIKTELVFANKRLEFKPPLEQIRLSHFTEMKRFIMMPIIFEGLGNADVYRKMTTENSKYLRRVYVKSEGFIGKLSALLKKYSMYTRLAQVDLDSYIENYVVKTDSFLINFKELRNKKKEVDRIPDFEKIDCCTINMTPFKNFLENLLRQVEDSLLISLRRNILQDFKVVDEYLDTANERLNTRPHSVEDIGIAKRQWKDIDLKKDSIKALSKSCVERKKVLSQYSTGTFDSTEINTRMANIDGEGGRWDEFDISLETFNEMIEEQKEALKVTLDQDVETLNVDIDKKGTRWRQLKPAELKTWEPSTIQKVFDSLDDWKKQFSDIEQSANNLTEACLTFSMPKPRFDGLEALLEDLNVTLKTWDLLKEFYSEMKVFGDQDWLSFSVNVYVLQDFATKWTETLKAMYSKRAYDSVGDHVFSYVERIKKSIPALKYCRGEPFKEDHWNDLLQGKLQMDRTIRRDNVKVENFLAKLDILIEPATLTFVKNLQARALGEVQIRESLSELKTWEKHSELKLLTSEESGRKLPLVKDWKDLFVEMGDKQSLLGSLKESPFYKDFSSQGNALEAKLAILDFVLQTLNAIQRKWVYLEPIFGKGSLPAEEKRFKRVDESFSQIMIGLARDPKLFSLCEIPGLSDDLKSMLFELERCQKALTEFLEAKRSAFPRFYFIGDDDLLEILGQSKNPVVIQSHLKKLFQGIHKVEFNADNTKIVAMISSSNEKVKLQSPVAVNDKVEEWLELLVGEMRLTLATLLTNCLQSQQLNWTFPSQILCLAQSIRFTDEAEVACDEGVVSLRKVLDNLKQTLHNLTSQDFSGDVLVQTKMKSLVFDLVHEMDVVEQLIQGGVTKSTDWLWKKQLRYYRNNQGQTLVQMHDATFEYTFEYQGNAPRLVHTPLTDKCYLTLTQGMKMGFGGNPYGPAGTGKTESVKALSQCLGRQVLVFNCDEALESTSMVRIFIGIVKCGAWGCFDEFNRLKEDQLSAISQQIQTIQDAIKGKITPITLLGRSVDVNFNSGIFVTLNPAGKGYGGRSRLPDNLKALFRPVAMGSPDNELIAEVSLVTEGFTQARSLASKIVSLFNLSKQLLSQQQHYDWGLRALKAVLNSGGRLIQSYKHEGKAVTPEAECEILIKAVRVNTLSKLTYADTSKFLALIGDVFPGVKSADISGGELEEKIKEVIKGKPFHLVEDAGQIKKMIQLKESLDQRMGCVIVGPSGCGKTSLWRVLEAALKKCGKAVVTHVMNPKSMPRERLLGHMDVDTREWHDGVLTDAARQVVLQPPEVSCWIICDGDVDPEWIESLNSVLDDNHLLTLPNGERINFGPNVNFLFETHDLHFASPATVSRMGMIFLSDEDLDVKRLVAKWLSALPSPDMAISMSAWIDELFYKALDSVLNSDAVLDTTLVGTVMNGLSQIRNAKTRQEFICGLIRGLGGNLSLSQRTSLAKEVFQWAAERPPDLGAPLDCYASGSSILAFSPVSDSEQLNILDIGSSAVINTVSVQRSLATLTNWIDGAEPFILVGPEGCGKSMIIQHAFRQRKGISVCTLHCNAQTTADDVISKITQMCSLFSSSEGRIYRPRDCERLVLYLKDINLPKPDKYDTSQLISFLQQLITFGGFYDQQLEFLKLEKIQIVSSINAATTVGRHQLSTRFTAVVRICVVDYPETSELTSVYKAFLNTVLANVKISDKALVRPSECEKLANAVVDIYQKTKEKFTVDDRRHYLFTPRDVTLLVKNICRYDLIAENLYDVVAYEASRVFRDRLVGMDPCSRFDQQLGTILRSTFRHTMASTDGFYMTSLTSARGGGGDKKDGPGSSEKKLDTGGPLFKMSEAEFKKLVQQGVTYYEREERELGLLLHPEILEHISHMDRVLSTSGGHLLLVGRSGVGRRNATTIASYMLGYDFFTPAISRDYQSKNFCIDIKTVLQSAGIRGEHIVMLIEDFQIVSDSILEIINSLLSSGEVPGLYTHEELEPLLSPLREMMREEGSNFRTPYEYFVSRIRKYLHIVMCMDPGHSQFLYRCESNPALYSQCSVLWMGDLRTATLKSIPKLMEGISNLISGEDERGQKIDNSKSDSKEDDSKDSSDGPGPRRRGGKVRGEAKEESTEVVRDDALVDMVLAIHTSCSPLGASPHDYIMFLKTWYALYGSKKDELSVELGHLQAGLNKLESAAAIVNDLRTNAVQQKHDLKIAQTAADRAMDDITKALGTANERKIEVAEVKKVVAANEEKTIIRKREIEDELSEIQPVLDQAMQAVGQIKSEHLNEIRALTAPPEAIADVLAAVLMMLGNQDLSWLAMKKFLGNRGVKDDIIGFDARTKLTGELRKNVAKLIKKKSSSFEDDVIKRVSQAAAPLALWVKANIRYSLVIEKIEPLQAELDGAVSELEESQKRLQSCEEELREIDERVANLKKEFGARTAEAERLKRNLDIAGTTLDKAESLIKQLSGENTRWKAQAQHLRSDIAKLPMKMLLAAGFATYLAKTPEDVRETMMKQWMDATQISSFSFKRVMSTESELLLWKSMGLPSDDLSQENSLVIAKTSNRVPFIIDPASAATDWLKAVISKDKSRPLETVSHHDHRFTNQVELAIRFGKALVILEVDGVEPMLYPLCRKDLCQQGARQAVSFGDKYVDYNDNFRLYLVTRNPSPDIPPDAASLVSQINFTVTRSGLEGQLLAIAIQNEQPELEKAKGEMLKREEDFKLQLAGLEKNLLESLATAEGNLLENTQLIESLSKTKEKAAEIEDALLKSAEASIKLDQQREVYRQFAKTGSMLFFLVKSLQAVNTMYQFSLASVLNLFKAALKAEMEARNVEERLNKLCADIEVRVLYFVGRALFKADRLMFALHLIRGMHGEHFQPKEFEIFTGTYVASVSEGAPKGFPSWAPQERQDSFKVLLEHVPHLVQTLELENSGKWQRFSTSLEAERDIPPIRGIGPFQRVLVVQAFRPDRLYSSMSQFCTDLLRIDSISPPPLSLTSLFEESDKNTPILLISSPGADPSKELEEFAQKQVGAGQYEELAMGGGQQEVAIRMLKSAAQNGSWLCLKNLHLVAAWLPTLGKELTSIEPHKDFRLWLTSESHPMFPSILLQQALKATYESPPGIKKNLQRTFESWNPSLFDGSNNLQSRLLFILGCFHSVLQERRNYIPQGWTKFYEFSYGDLKAGTFVIEAATKGKSSKSIDWDAVHGLMQDAIYGGRVDNSFDMRVLQAYLKLFFTERLSSNESGGQEIITGTPLRMPANADYASFKRIISQLPDSDAPFMFSLPDNIERSLQRTTSSAVIKQLRALSTLDSEGSKFDRDKWRAQLSPVLDVWQQLTQSSTGVISKKSRQDSSLVGSSGGAQSGKGGGAGKEKDPVDDFVHMENELAGDICNLVDSSLSALRKVLFGSGLLTPYIQSIALSLLSGAVPLEWTKRWDRGPEKPQAWLREVVRKRVSLTKWRTLSMKGSLLSDGGEGSKPNPLALGDLFNPTTFINALRQQSARKLGTAIDRVKLTCSWDAKQIKKLGPLPCTLTSLLLQGASYSSNNLEEPSQDMSEIVPAPNVHIGFVPIESFDKSMENDTIGIPIYLNPSREDLLTELRMSSKQADYKWILSGVALFLTEAE